MNSLCDKVQVRLLEPSVKLTPQEELHARSCAACREVKKTADETGFALSALGREMDREQAIALPAGLQNRVRSRLAERIDSIREEQERKLTFSDRVSRWLGRFGFPHINLVRVAWFAGPAILLIALFSILWVVSREVPVGKLDYAEGLVEVRQSRGNLILQGLLSRSLENGTVLRTPANAGGLVSLGKESEVRLALAETTHATITHERQVDLEEGEIWLRVKPQGRGLLVTTPFGVARVTGTIFGVAVSEAEMRVEVTEGTVVVSQAGNETSVTAGRVVSVTAAGIGSIAERAAGSGMPDWVSSLLQNEAKAAKGSYIPSVTAVRKQDSDP